MEQGKQSSYYKRHYYSPEQVAKRQTPEYKAQRAAYMREYYKRDKAKAYYKEYNSRPEIKERRNARLRERRRLKKLEEASKA